MSLKRIRESEEMYLETILLLRIKQANVRAVDVGGELGYAKSSVSRGLNLLKQKGFIEIDTDSGAITFTEKGKAKAEGVYEKHQVLTAMLIKMGADKRLAEENACRIEHVISDELMELFKRYIAQG